MNVAAAFNRSACEPSPAAPFLHGDNKRWGASFALVLVLHVVGAMLILRWYQNLPVPTPQPPTLTMIELAPLPPPPAPPVAALPPPPPPAPQIQPQDAPVPVAKPIVRPTPRPVVKHIERPQVQPQPTQTVEPVNPIAPTPMPPAQPSVSAQAIPRFTDQIAAQLERYKRYPALAQRRGEQGVALLRFTLTRTGGVSNARIERASGHAALDEEVLALVQRAQPLPAIPLDIAANTLDIEVPVKFALH
jgi:periplasmic protein TonB